jgi:general secretion pathway protein F
MPVYSFEAISSAGDTRKGVIDADSAKAARAQLRSQALVPLKVEPVSAQSQDAGKTASGHPCQMNPKRRLSANW